MLLDRLELTCQPVHLKPFNRAVIAALIEAPTLSVDMNWKLSAFQGSYILKSTLNLGFCFLLFDPFLITFRQVSNVALFSPIKAL